LEAYVQIFHPEVCVFTEHTTESKRRLKVMLGVSPTTDDVFTVTENVTPYCFALVFQILPKR